ncbi:MAG: electron transfer flavoprotein subunit alpha/FixB family protein [Dehalococcoidia bacterium]|nr:electron transfer flavoprotein subunit alpha/FixB family protein [Dehalococcoidia bacterium]
MDAKGVLIVGETADGELSSTSKEILAAGRALADSLGQELSIGVLGRDPGSVAEDAARHGADRVYAVAHSMLEEYHPDLYLAALESLARDVAPAVLLMGRTASGRDLAPRLAFRLSTGLAQDCLEVRVDESGSLLATRPVYGGNAMATVSCNGTPHMAAIRPKAYEPLDADDSRHAEVVDFAVELDASMARSRVVETVKEEAKGIKLEEAGIVVAGGRGLGGPEPFADLQELASVIGAGVGASRAAVDSGWVPPSFQIGLTGMTITPDLYITVGISGASQHMAGCSGAKVIVAINKDSEANIFKEARYGVVGDWKNILPGLTEALRDLVKS